MRKVLGSVESIFLTSTKTSIFEKSIKFIIGQTRLFKKHAKKKKKKSLSLLNFGKGKDRPTSSTNDKLILEAVFPKF